MGVLSYTRRVYGVLCRNKAFIFLKRRKSFMIKKKNIFLIFFIMVCGAFLNAAYEVSPGVFIPASPEIFPGRSNDPSKRTTSYPFLSSDTLRMFCTYKYDETHIPISPAEVKDGDTIYVNATATLLDDFFADIHPLIKNKYILVTHASDESIPGKYRSYLDDDTLAAWFGPNVSINHPKMFFIPIGIACKFFPHGNTELLTQMIEKAPLLLKNKLLYMNFNVGTNRGERRVTYDFFASKPFCYRSNNKSYRDYLFDTAHAQFILSPAGNGMDCHRTWEALFMGSFPVTKHSPLDKLYEQFPIVIVDDWAQVTEEFLNKKYEELKKFVYDRKKLYAPYWLDQIKACQERVRAGLSARDTEESK
jgi:hypothetical protein